MAWVLRPPEILGRATLLAPLPVRMPVMRTILLTTALVSIAAFAQTPMDKTLVVVNGRAIDAKEYYKRMEVLPNVGSLVNDKFVQATPGYLTLSKLMDETLMLQLANQDGVYPSDAEVEAAVKQRAAENPDLIPGFTRLGFTMDDIKYDTLVQLAQFKLQTMGINITDQEVEKFYNDHPTLYSLPKRYRLRVITVDSADKEKAVDAALKGGKAFGDVAREMSTDLTNLNDGLMGNVPESALAGDTLAAIKSTKKGGTTDWLGTDKMFAKILVEDVLEATKIPLDDKLKAQTRRTMMLDRGRVKNDLGKMMADFRAKAKIEYKGTVFDDQLKSSFGKG